MIRANRPKLFTLCALALLCGGRASAQYIVNIDINSSPADNYSGQGAFPDPGHNFWNSITSSAGGTNLIASDGTTGTSVSFSYSGANGPGTVGATSYAGDLLKDYIYTAGSPASFTIGGLTPGMFYAFYFYSQPGNAGSTDRAAIFTLNGISKTLTGLNAGALVEGSNYVMFEVTPSGTSLSGTFARDVAHGGAEAELNGLQILAGIPEPSSYAAIGGAVALAGAMVFRRRGRRSLPVV